MRKDNADILDTVTSEFIKATNEILGVYESFPSQFTLKENFSKVLMRIYQGFMVENFPSAQLLVNSRKIFSFSILCRSTLDIIIQIAWILSLNDVEREKAITCFLEFEGIGLTKNGKIIYEWQALIDPRYSSRAVAIALELDKEILSLSVNKIYRQSIEKDLLAEKNADQLKLTVFDYLSKVSHWNPRFLYELVGVNKDMHLGYTPEYLRMSLIVFPTFLSCAVIFSEIFCGHFFEDKDNHLQKLLKIKTNFEKLFTDLINNSLIDSVVEG